MRVIFKEWKSGGARIRALRHGVTRRAPQDMITSMMASSSPSSAASASTMPAEMGVSLLASLRPSNRKLFAARRELMATSALSSVAVCRRA